MYPIYHVIFDFINNAIRIAQASDNCQLLRQTFLDITGIKVPRSDETGRARACGSGRCHGRIYVRRLLQNPGGTGCLLRRCYELPVKQAKEKTLSAWTGFLLCIYSIASRAFASASPNSA